MNGFFFLFLVLSFSTYMQEHGLVQPERRMALAEGMQGGISMRR